MIVFGGAAGPGGTYTNDVWVMINANGVGTPSWTQLFANGAPGSPPPRLQHTAVYDPVTNRMMVFGGFSPSLGEYNDAWVLTNADGTGATPTWIQLTPSGTAPARCNHGAVYDPASNRMIIFLGDTTGYLFPGLADKATDVWALTNANGLGGTPAWIKLLPSGSPPPRWVNSIDLAYDPGSNRLILYGGSSGKPNDRFTYGDTWVLNNANGLTATPAWQQLNPTGSVPIARMGARGFYDSATNRMVIYGGTFDPGDFPVLADTWVLSNANGVGTPFWQQVLPQGTQIAGRLLHEAVYDKFRNLMIVYGGQLTAGSSLPSTSETWVLSNANGLGVNQQLRIDAITPNHGGNAGTATVRLTGAGFESGVAVKLTGIGQDILGTNTQWIDSGLVTTTFDLTGVSPGLRTVVLTNPDNSSVSLLSSFTVEQGGAAQIWVDIIGRDSIRIGQSQTFYIAYGNRGNVDAVGVPVWIGGIPLGAEWSAGFKVLNTVGQPGSVAALSNSTEQRVPLLLGFVAAGSSGALAFSVQVSDGPDFELRAWTSEPYFGSSEQAQVFAKALLSKVAPNSTKALTTTASALSLSPGETECAIAMVKAGVGLIGGSCAAELASHFLTESLSIVDLVRGIDEAPVLSLADFLKGVSFSSMKLSVGECAELTAGKLVKDLTLVGDVIDAVLAVTTIQVECNNALAEDNLRRQKEQRVRSLDPNVKLGSQGVGSTRYIPGTTHLPYSIYFDNQPTATAPAQAVTITDTLNASLDLNTLILGPITLANQVVTPPSVPLSVTSFTTTVDLRPTTNLFVRVNASLNTTTSVLTWILQSLDPGTGLPPTDPLAGFLQPGAEGSVFFFGMPKSSVTTGTVIPNTATVVFDTNPPINTPTWVNTIDNAKPVSKVSPLPTSETASSFLVAWSGTDLGAGIQDFTIYVSDNGGAFTQWQIATTALQSIYTGLGGHAYGFYSIARDLTGNIEDAKTAAEATTVVIQPVCAANATGSVAVTRAGFRLNNTTKRYVQSVALKNNSASAIAGPISLVLDGLSSNASLFGSSGTTACSAPLGSPFLNVNLAGGTLSPGATTIAVLEFTNPTNQGITYTTRVLNGAGTR